MFRAWRVSCLVGAIFTMACASDQALPNKLELQDAANMFIPHDATEKVLAPDIPWVQISFNVRREPLEFAVSVEELSRAAADGWILCKPQTFEWMGFNDFSVTPNRYTKQRTYLLYKDGILITLLGMYHYASESSSVEADDRQTDMPIQHGVVIARNVAKEESLATANSQGLVCDGMPRG